MILETIDGRSVAEQTRDRRLRDQRDNVPSLPATDADTEQASCNQWQAAGRAC